MLDLYLIITGQTGYIIRDDLLNTMVELMMCKSCTQNVRLLVN